MQSTGQTSTQAVSFVPIQGSVMMYAKLLSPPTRGGARGPDGRQPGRCMIPPDTRPSTPMKRFAPAASARLAPAFALLLAGFLALPAAAGFMRLKLRKSRELSAEAGESSLHFPVPESGDQTRQEKGRGR